MTFSILYSQYPWKPVRNCPGRYLLKKEGQSRFKSFFSSLKNVCEFTTPRVKNTVFVTVLQEGSLSPIRREREDFFTA